MTRRRGVARTVRRDHGEEAFSRERKQLQVGQRTHRRRAWHAAEQRDVAEAITSTKPGHRDAVTEHLGFTRLDEEVAVAGIALCEDHTTGLDRDGLKPARELLHGR